jgi:hypothetical protein
MSEKTKLRLSLRTPRASWDLTRTQRKTYEQDSEDSCAYIKSLLERNKELEQEIAALTAPKPPEVIPAEEAKAGAGAGAGAGVHGADPEPGAENT